MLILDIILVLEMDIYMQQKNTLDTIRKMLPLKFTLLIKPH